MAQTPATGWWEREAPAIGLGAVFLALAIAPRNAAALTGLLGALLLAALLGALRFRRARLPRRSEALFLGIVAAPVAWLVIRAFFAADPRISFVGNLGQHQGALTWLAALLVLFVALLTRLPGDAGRSARAVAVFGAGLAVTALLDAVGIIGTATFSPEASGVVENSITLAQTLVIALGCSVAWLLARRGRPESWVAVGAGVAIVAGLVAAQSSAAWLGIGLSAAAVAAGFVLWRAGRAVSSLVWSGLVAGLSVAGVGVTVIALRNGVEPGIETSLARLSNERFTIWTSAVAGGLRDFAIGRGPEQFSAWVTWDLTPAGAVTTNATYDPHNVWLYFLIAGGIVGLVLAIAAAALLVKRLTASPSAPAIAAVSGLAAFGVAAMFGWVSPVSLLVAALVTGSLLAVDLGSFTAASKGAALGLTATALLLAGAIFAQGGSAEYEWARATGLGAVTTEQLSNLAQDTSDPSLASQTLTSAFATPGGAEVIVTATKAVTPELERASDWHADAAFSRFQLAAIGGKADDDASWARVEAALSAGKNADPASGLWDTLGALQARSWNRTDDATAYAEKALRYPLPEQAKIELQQSVR